MIKVVLSPPPVEETTSTQTQTPQAIWDHLQQHVKGTPTPLTDAELAQATDWPKVRKYYRLNGVPALERLADEEEKVRQSERLAIMCMALRGL